MYLQGNYSVANPVSRGWSRFFETKIYVCHHSQVFSNLVFSWELLLASQVVFSLRGLLRLLGIFFFKFHLSIKHFSYFLRVLSFSIFSPQIVLFLLPPVTDLSLWTLHLAVGIIFFILSFHTLRVFHTSFCWWSFMGVWITESLFNSPWLLWVFILILMLLCSGSSRFFLCF